jgi:hypothetical protein
MDVDALLAVHSLYYLDPDKVAFAIEKTRKKLMVAVVHRFPDFAGEIANGEATYERTRNGTVRMKTSGGTTYEHDPLDWLSDAGSMWTPSGTLVWSLARVYGQHAIYKLTVVHSNAVRSIATVALRDLASLPPGQVVAEVPDCNSFGSSTNEWAISTCGSVVTLRSGDIIRMASTVLVDAARKVSTMTTRDTRHFRGALSQLRAKLKELTESRRLYVPPHLEAEVIETSAKIGFLFDVRADTAFLQTLGERSSELSLLERLLSDPTSGFWRVRVARFLATHGKRIGLVAVMIILWTMSRRSATAKVLRPFMSIAGEEPPITIDGVPDFGLGEEGNFMRFANAVMISSPLVEEPLKRLISRALHVQFAGAACLTLYESVIRQEGMIATIFRGLCHSAYERMSLPMGIAMHSTFNSLMAHAVLATAARQHPESGWLQRLSTRPGGLYAALAEQPRQVLQWIVDDYTQLIPIIPLATRVVKFALATIRTLLAPAVTLAAATIPKWLARTRPDPAESSLSLLLTFPTARSELSDRAGKSFSTAGIGLHYHGILQIEDACMAKRQLNYIHPGSDIVLRAAPYEKCEPTVSLAQIGIGIDHVRPVVSRTCGHNGVVAMVNRQLIDHTRAKSVPSQLTAECLTEVKLGDALQEVIEPLSANLR